MTRRAGGLLPFLLAAALLGCAREPGVSPGRARLIAAGARPEGFQACLAGILPGGEAAGLDLAATARAARAIASDRATDRCTRARDLALLRAWTGDLEGALARLDEAGPAAVDPWCEAERAAYLAELGERDEDPEALLGAVAAADRALAAVPEHDIARCNRALALERLALRAAARWEWRVLAGQQRSEPVAEVAERRVALLEAASPAERWSDFATRIERSPGALSRAEIAEAARSMPQAARQVGLEVLLGEAATAALRGESARAEPYLATARFLGERLAGHGGDATLSRAAKEVQRSIAARPAGIAFLAGVEAYRQGRQLRRKERYAEAAAEFALAVERLDPSSGALGAWARHAEAAARWIGAARAEERTAIDWERLLREAPTDLPALRARYAWSAGVAADLDGDLPRALRHFDAAIGELARLGEAEDEAWVRALRAFVLSDLGRDREAGTDLLLAMRARDRIGSDATLELILDSWIWLIVSPRWPELADLYYGELTEIARAAGRPSLTTQALLRRGEHAGTPAPERARHLDAAAAVAQTIQDPGERLRKLALIHSARTALALVSDPQRALDSVTQALAGFEARGLEPERLPALRIQARAYLALGRLEEAESTLLAAVAVLDRAQARSESLEERMRTLLDARPIFEDLAGLRLLRRGDSDGAFEAIELGRARSVLARATSADPQQTSQEGDPEQLARRLPRGYELVEFAFIDDRLAIWHLSGRGVRSAVVPADRVAVRTAAERLAADLAADRESAAAQAVELGRLLLAPVAHWLERGATLVVVPDPALMAIPWPALADPETGQPLVVSRPVLVAPSARWVAGVAERSAAHRSTHARVLGDAAFGHEIFPELAALPGSAVEAQSVAALYPGSELLLGGRATAAGALAAPLPEVLHLAAHGLAPTHAPERAALVLAPDAAHPAGLLPTPEIAARALRGVELVVLSACASARGPAYGSEGILSLTNAFLAAGVPAVVASSWPIEDAATREIMVAFHRGIAAGLAPSAALRRAQLVAMEEHRSRPSIWAAFGLSGAR